MNRKEFNRTARNAGYKTNQMKKTIILAAALLSLAACRKREQSVEATTNSNFNLELLFEKDGCKVYRFYDQRWVYYTTCDGSVQYEQKHGKSTDQYETMTTSQP